MLINNTKATANSFNRWWVKYSSNSTEESKALAYAAWLAGVQEFIKVQEPICFWEVSKKASDHVSFDEALANRWKTTYNMIVKPLYELPLLSGSDTKVSNDCIDD